MTTRAGDRAAIRGRWLRAEWEAAVVFGLSLRVFGQSPYLGALGFGLILVSAVMFVLGMSRGR